MRAGCRWTWPRKDSSRVYTIFTGRPVRRASRQTCICMLTSSRAPNAPPTPARVSRTFSGAGRGRRRPGRGRRAATGSTTYSSTPPSLASGTASPDSGPEERLVLHADLVGALDDHVAGRVRIAVPDAEVAEHVAVGVDRRGAVDRRLGVDQRLEHLVVDLDGRAGAPAASLGVVGGHGGDRLAVEAHHVVGEHRLVGVLEAVGRVPGHVVRRSGRRAPRAWPVPGRCRSRRSARRGTGERRVVPHTMPSA